MTRTIKVFLLSLALAAQAIYSLAQETGLPASTLR